MKGIESKRINFLVTQGQGKFTYKRMISAIVGWCVILVLAGAVGIMRETSLKSDYDVMQKTVLSLRAKKIRTIELFEATSKGKVKMSSADPIVSMLINNPRWAVVLKELSANKPKKVWLDQVGLTMGDDMEKKVTVTGRSISQAAISDFVLMLESSGTFKKTALSGTKSGADGVYGFDLKTSYIAKN